MAKQNRASWFKMFLHEKALFDAVPDASVGKALKAAMAYFETGVLQELDTLETVLFLSMRPYIDEANSDFEKKSENGKKGGRPKKQNKPEVFSEKPEKASETEAEAEAEAEAEKEESVCRKADKPPARTRFVAPGVQEVTDYCRETGLSVDPQRFVDYYASTGWCVGKSPMKDWKAALRNWNRKETPNGKTEPESARKLGIRI